MNFRTFFIISKTQSKEHKSLIQTNTLNYPKLEALTKQNKIKTIKINNTSQLNHVTH